MDAFRIGDLEVHRIEEVVDRHVEPNFLFPDLTPETIARHTDWLAPNFYDRENKVLLIFVQSWLIKAPGATVLIDTGGGNHKPRPYFSIFDNLNTNYLEKLAAAGCRPEEVDFVICTHLHLDHVGWNTRLERGRWVPTFPNARYLFSKREYAPWDPKNRNQAAPPAHLDIYEDSVAPVVAAGLAQMVEGVFPVNEYITLEPAPGHAVGHCVVRASSRGMTGIFAGDILHHAIQIVEPDCNSSFDADPVLAQQTRRRILEDCAEHGHLFVPGHFGPPHVGRIGRRPTGYYFCPGL